MPTTAAVASASALVEQLATSLRAGALPAREDAVRRPCDYEPYESTRAFYRARGFAELIELDIWGPENPATLFVRPL